MSTCSRVASCFHLSSPIGQLELTACDKGIHSLDISGVKSDDNFKPNKKVEVELEDPEEVQSKIVKISLDWLMTYFHDSNNISQLNLPHICHLANCNDSAPFTKKVWWTLATKVPFGDTITYGQLAEKSGSSSKASRAVGQAMRNNPVAIIVPCHRVIQSNGSLGNYSGGDKNSVKKWLLQHEGMTS